MLPASSIFIATPCRIPCAVSPFPSNFEGYGPGIDGQAIYLYNAMGPGSDFTGGGASTLKVTTLYVVLVD